MAKDDEVRPKADSVVSITKMNLFDSAVKSETSDMFIFISRSTDVVLLDLIMF